MFHQFPFAYLFPLHIIHFHESFSKAFLSYQIFTSAARANKTKDILHVKQLLGHRNINSTLTYTQLVNFESDEYHVRVAENVKQDKELIEAGFEYVTDRDGLKVYRKRK